jgi:hypothetical protein
VDGALLGRFLCHCTICQDVYKQPYSDVTVFHARAIALAENSALNYKRLRPPPAIDRGLCPACGSPVVAFMAFGPMKIFGFVPTRNLERPAELPNASLHIFYHRRVADIADAIPKVSGYWPSELAVTRMALAGAFRRQSAV